MKKAVVEVPATSANLGPGYDVLGVAIPLRNTVSLDMDLPAGWATEPGAVQLSVDVQGEGFDSLPRDESNLVVRAAYSIFEKAKRWPKKLQVQMENRIPLSRGLGSSGAAILGGMFAARRLLGTRRFSDAEVLNWAVAMEGHPDNIVPAYAGGLCISGTIHHEVRYLRFPAPPGLRAVFCVPQKGLSTAKARQVLPSRIPLSAAVFTSSRVAFLLGSLLQKRYDWLGFAMEDVLHQPARAALIPGLKEVLEEAKRAGAWGAALSGAGPSVIALCKSGPTAARVGRAMQKHFAARGAASRWFETTLENRGLKVR